MKTLIIKAKSSRAPDLAMCTISLRSGMSKEELERLQKKISSPSNDGPIFVKTFFSEDEFKFVTEQLDYYGIIYETDKNGQINVIGAKDKEGNVIAQSPFPKLKNQRSAIKPQNNGKWYDPSNPNATGEEIAGNGRFMPDEKFSPIGHPANFGDDPKKQEKNKDTQNKRNNEPAKYQPKDLGLTLYDKEGKPIRYPWGTPGQKITYTQGTPAPPEPGTPPSITPATIISQVEYYVNEHRKRHGLPDDYKFTGVEFVDNEPIMDEFSMGTVEMDNFTSDRDLNYSKADELIAEQLNAQGKTIIDEETGLPRPFTSDDVKNYRETNDLTWHEDPSCSKMMKVPTILHANIPHSGGISEVTTEGQETFYPDENKSIIKAQKEANNAQKAATEAQKAATEAQKAADKPNATNAEKEKAIKANKKAAEAQDKADVAKANFDEKAAPINKRHADVVKDAKPADANANIRVNKQSSTSGKANWTVAGTDKTSD